MYSHIKSYTVALIAVVIAFVLTQLVWWLIQPHLYPLFLAAVMVSSWYGGIGPGLFATVLAAILCNYFFGNVIDLLFAFKLLDQIHNG